MRWTQIAGWTLAAVLATQAWAQGFWASKEYTEWSRRDVTQMLQDSPWAKRHVLRRAVITMLGANRPGDVDVPDRSSPPEITYQVQFRSAQPLRQALVREQQLAANYEKMAEEQKREFDAATQKFLSAEFPHTIVVYVEYGSTVMDYDRALAYHWQNLTGDLVRGQIYLIVAGERIELIDYLPLKGSGRGFQLTFPRQRPDGSPVIPAGKRPVNIEFYHPQVGPFRAERMLINFDPRRMELGGKLHF